MKRTVRVAAAQAVPVFLDRDATTGKAVTAIAEAGMNGAELVFLPETFIPCAVSVVIHDPAPPFVTKSR